MLEEFGITQEQYREVVHKQYVKKFGKLGDAVVQSNMEVMLQGFEQVKEIASAISPRPIAPASAAKRCCPSSKRFRRPPTGGDPAPRAAAVPHRLRLARPRAAHRQHRRLRRGIPLQLRLRSACHASLGHGRDCRGHRRLGSKYVARRETPLYIPENCTQCMECISVCPDTALPNTSQDLRTVLSTAITRYVATPASAPRCSAKLPEIEKQTASAWSPR